MSQFNDIIDICAEDTGIDLVLNIYSDKINNDKVIVFGNAEEAIQVDTDNNIKKLSHEDLEELYKTCEMYINRHIEENKLSILGRILYKWDKKGYPVSPLLVSQIWGSLDVDYRSYEMGYDLDITEAIIKFIVYKLIISEIDRTQSMTKIIELLKEKLNDFLQFDETDSSMYAYGAITELQQAKVDCPFLYV